jgi:hypothetical protein
MGVDVFERRHFQMKAQFEIENTTNAAFVYNLGNPFSGTHFGNPRLFAGRIHFYFK